MSIPIDLSQMITAGQQASAALDLAKARARARLAAHVSALRAVHITVLPGQDMIYQAKEAEARAWLATSAANLSDYPLLAAEIGITAPDPDQLAQLWLNMGTLWRQAAAQIEALRLGTGAAIDAAETVEEVEMAVEAIG